MCHRHERAQALAQPRAAHLEEPQAEAQATTRYCLARTFILPWLCLNFGWFLTASAHFACAHNQPSKPHFCTLGNPVKSQDVHLRSPPDLYHTRRLAFCTRQDEHTSMSQCSATYIFSLPHMCTLGSPGKSPDDHLRSAFHLYRTRVLSEVLVKQEMIMVGRPSMESKNAIRRCGNMLRKC